MYWALSVLEHQDQRATMVNLADTSPLAGRAWTTYSFSGDVMRDE